MFVEAVYSGIYDTIAMIAVFNQLVYKHSIQCLLLSQFVHYVFFYCSLVGSWIIL